MGRQIYLPELLSIKIQNYTLYPNGLDYTYDFVKGINLILGGNGMGKTTFVNIIRFGLIGLYRKAMDITRTYMDRPIIKRLLYQPDYFSARKDDTIKTNGEALVTLIFKIQDVSFKVRRSLDNGCLLSVFINDTPVDGLIIPEDRYERLNGDARNTYLLYRYEELIQKYSNLTFDDLIFFVNEILFFGENHNTVLWNDGIDGRTDVQTELFNKYFNEPELNIKRQEMQRQAKYYDSLSRHRSEDMRVITKYVGRPTSNTTDGIDEKTTTIDIVALKSQIASVEEKLLSIRDKQKGLNNEVSILQGEINISSLNASRLDDEKKRLERELNASLWETLHPLYDVFVKNIQMNHLCPMCSQEALDLVDKINEASTHCFACDNEIRQSANAELTAKYKEILSEHKNIYQGIANKQRKIRAIEEALSQLDKDYRETDLQRRTFQQQLRELEYKRTAEKEPDKLQALDDQLNSLAAEKESFQKKSAECASEAQALSKRIEDEVLANVSRFSAIFADYAGRFLGVPSSLEYADHDSTGVKRFYPIIDGKIRKQEEALSESQRFFIDHSFRMSILTFFYQSPSFYIVETPDSSLDLSYEQNAADVFLQFLKNPNIVIITSNLNNSSFVNYLTSNNSMRFSMVGLPDIAKTSVIQGSNEKIQSIYNEIKSRL